MITTRFAPSPTGLLHIGHALAALRAHDAARAEGGRFLLRMEDLDPSRSKPEFEQAICEDLRWLGLDWDGAILRQSGRSSAYREALSTLTDEGLVYPCFCTRKDIADEIARAVEAPHGPDGPLYPGTCRSLTGDERRARIAAGVSYALRLDAAKASVCAGSLRFCENGTGPNGERGDIPVDPLSFGDIVLARKDMPAAYHLAVVVDDAFQAVTLVTRGNDLFAASHVQRLLQALLDLPVPRYAHHPLALDSEGRKFSKRNHAVTLAALRQAGVAPEEIRRRVERL
jgi:glutamyl-Q tRNA(Asp) synthetase